MKIRNFRNVVKIPSKDYFRMYAVKADVDVVTTTGMLWWTKEHVETRTVYKGAADIYWIWTDTGKWTPEFQVEHLYKAYCAQKAIEEG